MLKRTAVSILAAIFLCGCAEPMTQQSMVDAVVNFARLQEPVAEQDLLRHFGMNPDDYLRVPLLGSRQQYSYKRERVDGGPIVALHIEKGQPGMFSRLERRQRISIALAEDFCLSPAQLSQAAGRAYESTPALTDLDGTALPFVSLHGDGAALPPEPILFVEKQADYISVVGLRDNTRCENLVFITKAWTQ